MSEGDRKGPKQAYAAPKLVTYGDIARLTQSSALLKKKADGGGKLKTRTR
jgi:hypothetical protein